MNAREFLGLLASNMAHLPRARSHLSAFAAPLAKDVPARFLCAEVAAVVAGGFRALPPYADLLRAVRIEGEAIPASKSDASDDAGNDAAMVASWLRNARQAVAEGRHSVTHMLSFLSLRAPPEAWEKFAAEFAPDVLAQHHRREKAIADRRAGRIPIPKFTMPNWFVRNNAPPPPPEPIDPAEDLRQTMAKLKANKDAYDARRAGQVPA